VADQLLKLSDAADHLVQAGLWLQRERIDLRRHAGPASIAGDRFNRDLTVG
jgi:hypothetical protein